MIRSRGRLLAPLALSLVLSACALTTHYDATSYQNATNLKAETLLLVEKAKDPPGKHAQAIEALRLRLLQAYDYERGKGRLDRPTVEQWRLLIDPDAALLGGFLRKWKTENAHQSDAFLKGIARNVGDAFDEIIKVQSAKVKD
jgi:hypothetical protein